MQVLLAAHDSSLAHDTGPHHPERPARVPAVIQGVETAGFEVVDLAPEPIDVERLFAIHGREYVAGLERFCAAGGGALDMDTHAGQASWDAALRAASAGPEVVAALRAGRADLGYVAMRPPGHHAVADRAMGFCLFNNVAVAAAELVAAGERVAIVDWDVHHGNGTQDIFWDEPNVLYLSFHQAGIYPGTGHLDEVGGGAGTGMNLNVALPHGTGGAFYRRGFAELIVPVIAEYAPDWLFISSGYDASAPDPLAGLMLLPSDYGSMANQLSTVVPPRRTVVLLEGGYDLQALRRSARETVRGFLTPEYEADSEMAGRDADHILPMAKAVWGEFWDLD